MVSSANRVGPLWEKAIEEFTESLLAQQLSEQTIELRQYHLRRVAREFGIEDPFKVKGMDLVQWAGQQVWERETRRTFRSSMKKFYGWAEMHGHVEKNIGEMLPKVSPREPSPKPLSIDEVKLAYARADDEVKLMIRISLELGLRRAEVARIHPAKDIVKDSGGFTLVVLGKGAKVRKLPLPDDLATAMMERAGGGYLFPDPKGGHMTPHWVGTLVSRAIGPAGTMHSLRHTCATDLHNQTKDLMLVQAVLGHSSVATTQRYVAVDNSEVRDAVLQRSRSMNGGNA